jgi:chlorobactene glucosyltransferase
MTVLAAAVFLLVAANVIFWPKTGARRSGRPVSVLIPARDEEANLPACLRSVLEQQEAAEVLVYDDHSADGTRAVVEEFAQRDARVRLVDTLPLAAGWCGKTFACAQMARQARSSWMLFLDADTRLLPGALARAVGEAETRGATLLSCWPDVEMHGFWEKTLMPLMNFVIFTLQPVAWSVSNNHPTLGLAHGAFILVDKTAYQHVGGHEAVRDEIFEDTRLARLWRERGERSLCLDGRDVLRVRMYRDVAGIWNGFVKNFRPAFRSRARFWAFAGLHMVVFLGPFALGMWPAAALVLGARLLVALRFRYPLWTVPLHPITEAFTCGIVLASWWRCRSGRGVLWKGRRYAQ